MSTAASSLSTWTIDTPHTEAGFAVRHLMISTVRGRFTDVEGSIQFDPNDLTTGSADITIKAASIDTREAQRDAHLRSADFFDVEKFPVLTFKSRRVQAVKGESFQLVGDLTIKDVAREAILDVENHGVQNDPWGGQRSGFTAKTSINRKDYGLVWNLLLESGGLTVGEEVKITLDLELIKAK